MATLNYLPVSWNGITINAGNYTSKFEDARPGPHNKRQSFAPVDAAITGKSPGFVRAQPQSETWELTIKLGTTDETDVQAMNAIFIAGQAVYLRCTDGQASPITWRIVAVAQSAPQRVQGAKNLFFVPIHLPNPTWEEDTLNTNTVAAQTSSPFNLGPAGVVANAGTRDCQPKITITPKVAKSENSALNDAPYTIRTSWVNRAPNAYNSEPVYLFDQSGAAARLATGTAASGAVVRRTTNATTLTADPGAAGTTIAVTATAAFNVNGGLAIIEWVTGGVFGTMECISYATFSGLNLTGCVRGLGGTTAQAHAAASAIAACGTMPDGSDVRIEVDGAANQYRNVVAWNSAASDIVANMTADPAITLTLLAAMTAAIPAIGGTIYFAEGNGALDSDGFLKIGDEIFHYSALVGTTGVLIDGRNLWDTTAAVHAVNVPVYAKPHRIVISLGWAKADAAPSQLSLRPAIQLPGSSNLTQKWGDEADDPNTIYYDPTQPGRPKQWSPNFDNDGNTVTPIMSASITKTSLQFKDDVPGDGSPKVNNFEIAIPQGIKANDVNAWQSTWASAAEIINLEKFTRDAGGVKKLQDQLQTGAAAANRALPAVLAATAYAAILKGRYNIATGVRVDDSASFALISPAQSTQQIGNLASRFTISKAYNLRKIRVRMSAPGGGSPVVSLWIHTDASNKPSNLDVTGATTFYSVGGVSLSGGATPTWYTIPIPAKNITKPGTYWLEFAGPAGVTITMYGVAGAGPHARSDRTAIAQCQGSIGNWVLGAGLLWIYVLSEYDNSGNAFVEDDQPVSVVVTDVRTGTVASSDKDIIILEPLQTAYVHRNGAFVTNGGTNPLYHCKFAIAASASGESLSVDLWMKIGSTLTIDCQAGTMVYVEDNISYPMLALLGSSKLSLALKPGNNTLSMTDASLIAPGSTDVTVEWRGART